VNTGYYAARTPDAAAHLLIALPSAGARVTEV